MHLLTLLSSLLAWSEQVCILVAAGALASIAISSPKARLAMWQALLLLSLFLPVLEPWKTPPLLLAAPAPASVVTAFTVTPATQQPGLHWRSEYWFWIIAIGAALRLIFAAAGLLRLRRYRLSARPLPEPPLRFASNIASWYSTDSAGGPVTYGWRRPVILLPSEALDLPADLLEAIQCHELIHVYRGDWLFVLAENLLRSLLWFHPAVWFALSRINLAREQVVDREAVALLQNRESYLDALVAVAAYRLRPNCAPAFLRKRQLLARVEAVVKEVSMSRSRIAAAIAAVCFILPLAIGAGIWLFPFTAPLKVQAQTAPDSPGITVEPGAALLHRAPVRTPQGSTASGKVILEATLDAQGDVSDARVISGPQELRSAALSSVLQWHYQPGPSVAEVSIQFAGTAPAAASPAGPAPVPARAKPAAAPAATSQPSSRTLKSIRVSGITPEAEASLRGILNIREGDSITEQDMLAATTSIRNFDSHLTAGFSVGRDGGVALQIAPGPAVPVPPDRPGPGISNPIPISRPEPEYSEEARKAHWGGTVLLSVVVGVDGVPGSIKVVKPLGLGLDEKAIEAVSQWRFRPGMKEGAPVPVQAQIEVTFHLLDDN